MRRAPLAGLAALLFTMLSTVLTGCAGGSAGSGDRTEPISDGSPPSPTTASSTASSPVTPTVTPTADPGCEPSTPLVDPGATAEARCLAATLDGWQASGEYGVGQQLNVSNARFLGPLTSLAPDRPALVGFDLEELDAGEGYGFSPDPLDTLLQLSSEGVLLTASWHAENPGTGLGSGDRTFQDLGALLDPARAEYQSFWTDVDAKLELLRRLQTGDDGRFAPAAVLFRPFHEANGDWFWWAQGTDPSLYRQLYAALQQRAADAGVHNIVWGWSANAVNNERITDPLSIIPDHVDVVGIDSYESLAGGRKQRRTLDLTGLSELESRVPRIAVTEAGPHGSPDGRWDPTVIASSAVALGLRPAYTMLWFDDGDASDGYTGKKQISSLKDGPLWLSFCPGGVCSLT